MIALLLNSFDDDTREKRLRFTSNGARTLVMNLPKDAIIKEATLQLEAQELPDASIIRIGVVKNCTLEDFNMLEERLEITSWGKNTVQPGWGTTETTSFLAGESGRYRVIPIDPADIMGAHPSYYRREFDVIFIPNGPMHADLTNMLNSRIPIVTTNPQVALKIGLCEKESLHGAITNVHIRDRMHYICEQFRSDDIRIGGREDEQAEHILIDAIEPLNESVKGILDTGISSQSVLVTSMDYKYAYIGFSRIDQLLEEDDLFTILRRTTEWCGIGGYITNIGMEIKGTTGGFKKAGRLSDIVDTPDFSQSLNEIISSNEPNEEGMYPTVITFYSDSPGLLIVGNIRIDCVFLATITKFADEKSEVVLEFDSINKVGYAYVDIPKKADIKSATLRIEGNLSDERIGIISGDEEDVYGVTVSTQYTVAQQIKTERVMSVSRIALHLSKPDKNAELEVEIREDYMDTPSLDIVDKASVDGGDIKKEYSWVEIEFENLVLKPDSSYWILVKAKKGKVHWHADRKCPMGGSLYFTKDDGKTWAEHEMDALFKVFYKMESYDDSPTMRLLPSSNQIWAYSGKFQEVRTIPDFCQSIIDHITTHSKEFQGKDVARVPLTFSAQSIGTLTLFDLKIKCELPTLEMKEEVETATIAKELQAILELLAKVKKRVTNLMDGLPPDVLEGLEFEKV